MATLIWTDAGVTVNAVDLSDHVRSVSVTYEAEMQDETAMSLDTRKNKPGLLNWSVDVEFNQDFAAGEVDATLFPLVGAAAFAIAIVPVAGSAESATNPTYEGNVVLESYGPVDGAVGDLAVVRATFRSAGTLSRTTGA